MEKIKTVIIPIAGKGTRFLPVTKVVFKTLFPIINRPTIQYIIEEAVNAGIEHVVVVISETQKSIQEYFDNHSSYYNDLNKKNKDLEHLEELNNHIKVDFVVQEHPRGLGDAILCCEQVVKDESFGVMLGDDLVLSHKLPTYGIGDLIEKYYQKPGYYIGVQKVPLSETNKYGIIDSTNFNTEIIKVKGLVEKPHDNPPSEYACVGRYILRQNVFEKLKLKEYDGIHEIQLTDALIKAAEEGDAYALAFKGTRFDIGDKAGYIKASIAFALEEEDIKEEIQKYISELK